MDDKDKKFGEGLVQNIDEIRAEEEYGAKIEDKIEKRQEIEMVEQKFPTEGERKQRITEEEAKRLLVDEAQKTEANLKNLHSDKHKKTIVAIVIVAVVLCLGMLVAALMLGNRDKGEVSDGGSSSQIEGLGEGLAEEEGVVELSLDDEVAQKLYGQFDVTRNGFNSFYRAALGSELSEIFGLAAEGDGSNLDLAKIGVALANLNQRACGATYQNGDLQKRYEVWNLENLDETASWTCYRGEGVRGKVKEIFGEEIEFYPLKRGINQYGFESNLNVAVANGAYAYDAVYDEFYHIPDGSEGRGTIGELYKAQREGNKVYLYEVRAGLRCRPDPVFNEETQDWDVFSACALSDIGGGDYSYEWNTKDGDLTVKDMVVRKEDFPKFKWTFVKNGDGNYVFESLEKVNN